MDFTLSYFMMLAWTDDRLYLRPEYYENVSFLNSHPEQMGMIWRPDIFYKNERGESVSKPPSLSDSASTVFPSGEVQFVRKLETKFQCQLKSQNYPFDVQICHMDISSVAFTTDLLKFAFFNSSPFQLNSEIELTSFEPLEIYTEEKNRTLDNGIYHAVKIIFKFKRFINFYILQVKASSVDDIFSMEWIYVNVSKIMRFFSNLFTALYSQFLNGCAVMACALDQNGGRKSGRSNTVHGVVRTLSTFQRFFGYSHGLYMY